MIPITYKGKAYSSVDELARTLGINTKTLYTRLRKGYSIEEAVEKEVRSSKVVFLGKEYESLPQLVEAFGLNSGSLHRRLYTLGVDLETAVIAMLKEEPLNFKGVTYPNLVELAKAFNVEPTTVYMRLYRGKTLEEAVLTPVKFVKGKEKITFRGISYNSKKDVINTHGFTTRIITNLAERLNLDSLKALDIIITFTDKYNIRSGKLINTLPSVIYNNEWFLTEKDFVATLNVKISDFSATKSNYGVSNIFEVLQLMQNDKHIVWYDSETNIPTHTNKLVKKYKCRQENLLRRGYAYRREERKYPNLNFQKKGYCATPKADFETYLQQLGYK